MKRILSNPIYYGDFIWKDQYYKGKHQPLVTRQVFDNVQVQMGFAKRSKDTKHNFAFTNTMSCSHCGCSITAQEKRKKSGRTYVYYHCTSGKGKCEGLTYIREEKVDTWIADALSQIQIPENIIAWTKQALMESHSQEREYHHKQFDLLEKKYRTIKNKIDKAYEDKLEDIIDADFWAIQNERLNKELIGNDVEGRGQKTIEILGLKKRTDLVTNRAEKLKNMYLCAYSIIHFERSEIDNSDALDQCIINLNCHISSKSKFAGFSRFFYRSMGLQKHFSTD